MSVTGPYESEHADLEDVADAVLDDLAKRRGIHLLEASTPIPTLKVNIYFIERPVPTLIDAPSISPSSLGELDRQLKRLESLRGQIFILDKTSSSLISFPPWYTL